MLVRSVRLMVATLVMATVVGVTQAPGASAAPNAPAAGYGFAGGAALSQLSVADLNRELDVVRQTSGRWLRIGVDRSVIEVRPGVYDWSSVDRVLGAALARGLRPLAVIGFTPIFAGGGLLRTAPPANVNDFARFAGIAAQRYRGRIANWEVWNEPNLGLFFGAIANKSAVYTRLLRATYPAIKRASPGSTVIAAGLSRIVGSDSPPAFINDIYRFGGRGVFDAAALHPYVFPGGLRADQENGFSDIARVRAIMVANGDAGKKIWFTEIGAPTNGPRFGGNTPEQQRDQIRDVLGALAALPYAGPVFIYSIRDLSADPRTLNNRETRFGALLTYDYKLKPAFFFLKR